jgi:AraC-like DNA-binding protein
MSRECLAIMCQGVVSRGQSPPQASSAKNVHDIDSRHLGTLPTATGGIARRAYARARQAKVELGPLLQKSGLTRQQIEDSDARINVRAQIKFLDLVANALRDNSLGFHLAESVELRELGLLYYVAASSETLGDVLQRAARYSSIANEGLSLKYRAGPDITIEFRSVGVARHLDRHQIEFVMTVLIRICRKLTRVRLVPSRLRLAHRHCEECSELITYFGKSIDSAGAVDELTFVAKTKDMVVVSADPYLNKLLVANCEEALSRRPAARDSLRSAVENAIVPLLPHGKARASEIARRLGLSQRTCARRLSSEGATFSQVLDTLRGDLARQYLAHPELSISRIAWLLGYQEVGAFTHAFKRWTAKTPREARSQQGFARRR